VPFVREIADAVLILGFVVLTSSVDVSYYAYKIAAAFAVYAAPEL
jgi:hypothetical protein